MTTHYMHSKNREWEQLEAACGPVGATPYTPPSISKVAGRMILRARMDGVKTTTVRAPFKPLPVPAP